MIRQLKIQHLATNGEIIQVLENILSPNKITQKKTKEQSKHKINQNKQKQHIKSNLIALPYQYSKNLYKQMNKKQGQNKVYHFRIRVVFSRSSNQKIQQVNIMSFVIQSGEDEIKNKRKNGEKHLMKISQQNNLSTIQSNSHKNSQENTQEQQLQQIGSIFSTIQLNEYIILPVQYIKDDSTLIIKMMKYFLSIIIQILKNANLIKVEKNCQSDKKLIIQINRNQTLSRYYSELKELKINFLAIESQTRKQIIKIFSQDSDKQQQVSLQYINNKIDDIQQQEKRFIIDPFGIGQQINYYYSDKNYSKVIQLYKTQLKILRNVYIIQIYSYVIQIDNKF
ncbi:unnamed protein product [Paramecium primaurelia]|uniref:Uncharacterized protein n=1 Tax=Paramecium primaurelia TaxID=5886 RepID=A0A8S1NIT9_PARPR|nr:unnamed protein product [Paramecium primaurelia]